MRSFPVLLTLLPFVTHAQTDCYTRGLCLASCTGTTKFTGFIERAGYAFIDITISQISKVTFTNCESVDFDPYMRLYQWVSSSSSDITSLSDNNCDAYDCTDSHYACSTSLRETFTFSYLGAGDYYIRIGNPSSSPYLYGQYVFEMFCTDLGSGSSTSTPAPTVNIAGGYPGSTLLTKGFNIFTAEKSGSPILNPDYIGNMTESYTTEGSTCSYSSLQFTSQFSFYSAFATSHSKSIGLQFSAGKSFGAGGIFSDTRTETRSYAESGHYYIYSMSLECVAAQASIVEFNELEWNINFINALRILPTEYSTGDDLEEYIDFWDIYGTHIIESADFGGSIEGATVTNKCTVEESFESTTQYKTCLNAEYKGVSVEGCSGSSSSSSTGSSALTAIEHTKITVKGGDTSEYATIFNTFGDKEQNFQFWINDLAAYPDIVGGNINEIHDAIERAIKLGNHKLNKGLSTQITDDTFLLITNALEAAYIDYSKQLGGEYNFFGKDECDIDCHGLQANTTECVCIGCKTIYECCGIADNSPQSNNISFVFVILLLFCYCLH